MSLFVNRFLIRVFGLVLMLSLCLRVGWGEAADASSVVKIHVPGYSTSSLPFLIADELGFYREKGSALKSHEFRRVQESKLWWLALWTSAKSSVLPPSRQCLAERLLKS